MNSVELHKFPHGKYTLVINSQAVKTDFTGSTYEEVITEMNDYLTATLDDYNYQAGVPRLSGAWNDNMDLTISYSTEPIPVSFDGTNNYKVQLITHE